MVDKGGQIRHLYTQLIEYLLRIATTAVITPSTWPKRNFMRIVQQLGYNQACKSSHSSPTEDTSNLHSLCAYHTIQDGMGNPLDPVPVLPQGYSRKTPPHYYYPQPAPEFLMEIKLCRCPNK